MENDKELRREITEFLAQYDAFDTPESRKALLIDAGLERVTVSFDLTGNKQKFITLLCDHLAHYGANKAGEPALMILLRTVAKQVGANNKAIIQGFCERLRPPIAAKANAKAAPPQPSARSADLMNFDKELPAFERILRGDDPQTRLIRIHGRRGGEGKSTLLAEYERMAKACGVQALRINLKKKPRLEECLHYVAVLIGETRFPQFIECYDTGCAEPHNRLKEAEWQRRLTHLFFQEFPTGDMAQAVMLFDHYEDCDREFRDWLAKFFLPRLLNKPLVAVIAGREDVESPPPWEQQCRFQLDEMPIKWFFWYSERKHANLKKELIETLHSAFQGRPKEFVEFVETAVKRGVSL